MAFDHLANDAKAHADAFLADRDGILGEIRIVGGAIVMIFIIALVLNEVYSSISIPSSSAWSDVVSSLENTGVAALTLLVVGLLVIAATALMRYFNAGSFGGGRGQLTLADAALPVSTFLQDAREQADAFLDDRDGIMREVQIIGGGLIMILVLTLVIVEVSGAVNISSNGTFSGVVNTLESTGVAAMTLLVVGLLVIAASALLRFFSSGGFGGR